MGSELVLGVLFGVIATKSQIISWYRIQEMFRFHSSHMYGVILSAVAVAAAGVWIIKRTGAKDLELLAVERTTPPLSRPPN